MKVTRLPPHEDGYAQPAIIYLEKGDRTLTLTRPLDVYGAHTLLSGLVSPNQTVTALAHEALHTLSVPERVYVQGMIPRFLPCLHPALRNAYRPHALGLQLEDFALQKTKHLQSRERLFSKGDIGSEAYAVLQGEIGIGDSKRFVTLMPGAIFGEYTFLFETRRTANAFAFSPSQVGIISPEAYLEALAQKSSARILEDIALARERMADLGMSRDVPLRPEIAHRIGL